MKNVLKLIAGDLISSHTSAQYQTQQRIEVIIIFPVNLKTQLNTNPENLKLDQYNIAITQRKLFRVTLTNNKLYIMN